MALIPDVIGISPGDHGCGRTLTWLLQGAIDGGLKAVILREPHLSKPAYVELARRISPLLGKGLLLHGSHDAAVDVAEAANWGLHLPSGADIAAARRRVQGWLGASCHSAEELKAAADAGADYATISPVFTPLSKPSDIRPTLDRDGLIETIAGIEMPVFALGGINSETASSLSSTDIHGIASMGFLFPSNADADLCATNAASLCMIMKRRNA